MADPNPPGSDPINQVISVATSEVNEITGTSTVTEDIGQSGHPQPPAGNIDPSDEPSMGAAAHEAQENDVWTARYSFGNFAGRMIWGLLLAGLSLYCVFQGYSTGVGHWRILAILVGGIATLFWVWLGFRIFKARLSHHYHLTNKRLFVTSGIIRHTREMMELEHLKEVSIRQERMLDHLFKVGTVMVVSNVPGAPLMFLLGINDPQGVVDQIYHHARK